MKSLQDLIPFCADFYTQSFGQELFSDVVKSYFMSVIPPDGQEESEPHIASSPGHDTITKLKVPHLTIARSVMSLPVCNLILLEGQVNVK